MSTRRTFIREVGFGFAASTFLLPSSVIGKASPSKRLNIALIGCGGRMNALLAELLKIETVRVVAAVDPFEERRLAKAATCNAAYGGNYCRTFEDFREVLAMPDIDGVVVATPDHWHVPIAIAAARADKDMYVEKPLGLSLPRAAVLRKELARNRCVFQYGTQQHSSLSGRQAVELVWNAYVGKLQQVDVWSPSLGVDDVGKIETQPVPSNFNYDLWLGPAKKAPYSDARVDNLGAWHCYEYALGFIAGWGAHPIDILQWGLQKEHTAPVRYAGTGFVPQEPDLYNTVRSWDIEMTYANGTKARFMDDSIAKKAVSEYHNYYQSNGVAFHGTDGFVCHSRGACYLYSKGKYVNLGNVDFDTFDKRAAISSGHMQNFVDCMVSRETTLCPIDSAINGDAISHLSNAAVRTGRALNYNPKTLKVKGDAEVNAMLTRPMREPYGVA